MRKSRFTGEEGTVAPVGPRKPRRTDHWDDQGARSRNATAEVCRRHGLSPATFYKLKARYGGMDVSDAQRLRALE